MTKREPSCLLEQELFKNVFDKTPDYIKNLNLIDFDQEGEFSFKLKKEHLYPYDKEKNPEGLNLLEWFKGYAKEAKVSTAGIRGPQNILFPVKVQSHALLYEKFSLFQLPLLRNQFFPDTIFHLM